MRMLRPLGLLTLAILTLLGGALPAAAADPTTSWTAGPGAGGDDTYDGYVDLPAAGSTVAAGSSLLVGGWVVDKTAQGWAGIDQVQVFQGQMGAGGTMLAKGIVGQNRPDVGAALGTPAFAVSGFSASVPAEALHPGPLTLLVYAHTPSKGWWYKQTSVTVTVGQGQAAPSGTPAPSTGGTAEPVTQSVPGGVGATRGSLVVGVTDPKVGQQVHTDRDFTIMGYALDKSAGLNQGVQNSGVDKVEVFMDGPRGKGTPLGGASLGYSDPNAAGFGGQFANAGFRLTFHPTQFSVASHNLYVYARSAVNGAEVVGLVPINITDAPTNPTS
jgi:hypothetical protein